MNHMSEKDCHKFVEEVSAVGLDLKPYVYGEYWYSPRDLYWIPSQNDLSLDIYTLHGLTIQTDCILFRPPIFFLHKMTHSLTILQIARNTIVHIPVLVNVIEWLLFQMTASYPWLWTLWTSVRLVWVFPGI